MADEKADLSFPQEAKMAATHQETRPGDTSEEALVTEASHAANAELNMTLWQAIRTYPKAIGWSVIISSTLVMEGYDLALLGHLYANPKFNEDFGEYHEPSGEYVLSAAWQSGLSNSSRVGEVLGLFLAGWLTDKIGNRKTTLISLVAMILFIFPCFFAPNAIVLTVGQILCGFPWGAFQSIAPTYASEVSPVALRPYITTYINMCWVFGQFFAAAVNHGSVDRTDVWAYRIPFAVQWVWTIPLIVGVWLAPESPWWYVRHGKKDEAKKSLLRLTSRNQPNFNPDETIAMIEHTNELERHMSEGTSYFDCFRGIDLRRTEIVVCIWLCQSLSGQNLMGYFSYFMVQAGLDPSNSMAMSMGNSALGLVGTMGSWFLMTWIGRRRIHFGGVTTQCLILVVVGSLSFATANGAVWAIGGMLLTFTCIYNFTVGPVTYALISELSSTRLKAKTIVLARAGYNMANIAVNVLTNYQLSTTGWNWGARSAYFWAGSAFLCAIWVFFRLPEPKGRTYAELDLLFENKVPARKFRKTKIDPYAEQHALDKRASVGSQE